MMRRIVAICLILSSGAAPALAAGKIKVVATSTTFAELAKAIG